MTQPSSEEIPTQSSIDSILNSASTDIDQQTETKINSCNDLNSNDLDGFSPQNPTEESVISLVHQPINLEVEDNDVVLLTTIEVKGNDYLENFHETERSWLNNLLTPWGMGSILILLIANGLLSWIQLSNSRSLTTAENSVQVAPIFEERLETSTISNNSNLDLRKLSTLQPYSHPPVTAKLPTNPKTVTAKIPVPGQLNLANPQPSSDLTAAILPPSLRPQFAQPYPVSPSVIPVAPPSISINPLPLPAKVSPNPLPPPPPIKPVAINPPATVPVIVPAPSSITPSFSPSSPSSSHTPPTPSSSHTPLPSNSPVSSPASPDIANNQSLEQAIRDADKANAYPLNLPQRMRMKIQATVNKNDPNQLMRELQQLQQQNNQ